MIIRRHSLCFSIGPRIRRIRCDFRWEVTCGERRITRHTLCFTRRGVFVEINVKSCEIRPLVDGEGIGSGNNESHDWFQHFCPIITRVTQTQSEMITYYETPCCRNPFDHLIPVAGPAHHSRPGLDCWYQDLEILVKEKINKSWNLIIIRCCL